MRKAIHSTELVLLPIEENDEQLYMSLFRCSRTMIHVLALSDSEISRNFSYVIKNSRELYYSIFLKSKRKKIGLIGVTVDKNNICSSELGVLLLPKISPKGTAKLAMITLINFLFKNTKIDEIKYIVALKNRAAIRSCRTINVDFTESKVDADPQVGYIRKNTWREYN